MSGPEVITLGCRLNAAESEAMRGLAAGRDDLIIVNSCAVTNEAVRQARKAIRAAAKRRPGARILVTGCAAQIDPGMFAAMPEVSAVVGNREKREASSFSPLVPSAVEEQDASATPDSGPSASLGTNGDGAKIRVSDILSAADTAPHLAAGFGSRARAFVEVQTGCDHRCTFCIIPYGRGPSRSVPAGGVIERIRALVAEGYREIVLTGVDTTSYGPDLPGQQTLGHLVERVLTLVPELLRLRLSSLDSIEIDDHLFALLTQEPRLQPHLHLSLQAGDDMVLKRMKRRHTRAQSVAMVERLKTARSEIAIGADLIAGFPTETEQQALNTLALLDDCDIVLGHIFPYSARAGTPAARMPQHDAATIRARAARLRDAADARRVAWLHTLVGTEQSVLVERLDGRGHAANYAPIRLASGAAAWGAHTNGVRRGDVTRMRVTHVADDMLVGDLV
jgi:threonylcarbamoyladenosine tRNA methylthiotransferase MtaB